MGYPATAFEDAYWLEPGYGLADGEKTAEFMKMVATSVTWQTLILYVDAVKLEEAADDVLDGPVSELPAVLVSPYKKKLRRGVA